MQQRRMGKAHSLLAEVTCGYTVVGKTQPQPAYALGFFVPPEAIYGAGHLSSLADWL